jgi:hypothetical protein
MIVCACSHLIKLDWQCIRYKADYITILYDSLSVYWDRARTGGGFGVQHTKMIRDQDETDSTEQFLSALIQKERNSKYSITLRT